MKYGIISDIHSNIQALEKALEELEPQVNKIVCIGDVVGYNANPNECIREIRSNPKIKYVVQGNHDVDSAEFDDHPSRFRCLSRDAYTGIKYSHSCLSDKEKEWLTSLPIETFIEDKDIPFWISHYSPESCTEWGYINCLNSAMISLRVFKDWEGGSNLFFFGHSHVPTLVKEDSNGEVTFDIGSHLDGDTYIIEPDSYYLINPGSIGQPRSGITSYAILDTKERTVKIKSFYYNIGLAQKKIYEEGYSDSIANRLDPYHDVKVKMAKKEKYKKKQKHLDAQKPKTGEEG